MAEWHKAANWCDRYQCWCSDASEIIDGNGGCDYECSGCEECVEA